MRPQTLSRLISGLLLAITFGGYLHRSAVQKLALGRDAYLTDQARHFDRVVTLNAHSALPPVLGAFIVLGILFGAYEFLAFVVGKMIAPETSIQQSNSAGQGF